MFHGDTPHRVRQGLQISLPGFGELLVQVLMETLEQQLHDRFQEVFAPGDVPVQRHRLDTQFLTESAHRQTLGSVPVDEPQGCLDDRLPVQTFL